MCVYFCTAKKIFQVKKILFLLVFTVFTSLNYASDIKFASNELISHEVYFNTDEFTISKAEFNKLLDFIKQIESVDIDRISIQGFCDDRGSSNYNLDLSSKRANAIKNIITSYIKKQTSVLNVNGEGEVELTTEEQTLFNELRALNRKVIIVVAPKKLIAGSFYGEDLKTGDLINLNSLNFKKGLRYLTPESTESLKELAAFLVKRRDIYFTINGHVCCTNGGRDSRDKETGLRNLSEVRAQFIRDYLVKQGVNAFRVRYQGLKGKYNLGGDDSEDRRVELLVRYISK